MMHQFDNVLVIVRDSRGRLIDCYVEATDGTKLRLPIMSVSMQQSANLPAEFSVALHATHVRETTR